MRSDGKGILGIPITGVQSWPPDLCSYALKFKQIITDQRSQYYFPRIYKLYTFRMLGRERDLNVEIRL